MKVHHVTFTGKIYKLRLGPRGESVEARGATPEELATLDQIAEGATLVRRTGPTSYVVVRP